MFKSTTIIHRPVRHETLGEVFDLINQARFQLEEEIKFKKNKEFLYSNCNTIKRRFYHYRDKDKHPRITICILQTPNNIYTRGISLCSFLDQPIKSYGRDKAEDRAIKALKSKASSEPITRRIADELIGSFPEFLGDILIYQKSIYDVVPTPFELRLFTPPEK